MENIWNSKDKPKDYPGQDQMDLGVGMMFRKFHEIEELMVRIISASSSIDRESAQKQMSDWIASKKRFVTVVDSYKDLRLFDDARFGALDTIRTGRNYFAHSYSGKKEEYGRLKTLMENIDGTLKFLRHVDMKTDAELKRKENKVKQKNRNDLRSTISAAAKQCKKDNEGYVHLADVGNILKKQGIECKGLLEICKELGIQNRSRPGGPNANAKALVHYIRVQ